MRDVFISYSHVDEATAASVCSRLEAEGMTCWLAKRDAVPGDLRAQSITDAIAKSKAMVLVFSDAANGSPHVLREVAKAVSGGKPIIPLKLTDAEPTGPMGYYLETIHWHEAMGKTLDQSLDAILPAVRSAVRGGQAPSGAGHAATPSSGAGNAPSSVEGQIAAMRAILAETSDSGWPTQEIGAGIIQQGKTAASSSEPSGERARDGKGPTDAALGKLRFERGYVSPRFASSWSSASAPGCACRSISFGTPPVG